MDLKVSGDDLDNNDYIGQLCFLSAWLCSKAGWELNFDSYSGNVAKTVIENFTIKECKRRCDDDVSHIQVAAEGFTSL